MYSNYPDFKLIKYAEALSKSVWHRSAKKYDEELERRYESIKDELEAHEQFNQAP